MRKKKNNIIEKTAVVFLLSFCAFVMLASFADAVIRPDHVTLLQYIFGILTVGIGVFVIYILGSRLSEKNLKKLTGIISAAVFFAYIIEIFAVQVQPKVDLSHIISQSMDMLERGTHEFTNERYFSFYTNNIPAAIIVYWIFYIGKMLFGEAINYSIVGGAFNVVMIWMGILCFFALIDKVTHSYKTAFFYKMLMVFNPMFFVYASYYYTDTIAIPISIAAVLCVVTAFQSEKLKKYIFLFFSGILFAVAAKIRIVTLIIAIAIVVYLVYEGLWKSLFRLLTLFGAAFLITGFLYGVIYDYHVPFDTSEREVPITHFLMMGSHGNGTYDNEDVEYTKSIQNPEERKQKTWNAYVENLKNNGIAGNVKLLLKKEAVWGIGTRGYYQYIKDVKKETFLYQLIAGEYSGITKGILQAYNLTVMLLIFMGLMHSRHKLSMLQLILIIYWGGTILFTALWEAHPRHIMTYIPFLILMGIPFVEKFFQKPLVFSRK